MGQVYNNNQDEKKLHLWTITEGVNAYKVRLTTKEVKDIETARELIKKLNNTEMGKRLSIAEVLLKKLSKTYIWNKVREEKYPSNCKKQHESSLHTENRHSCMECPANGAFAIHENGYIYDEEIIQCDYDLYRNQVENEGRCKYCASFGYGCVSTVCDTCGDRNIIYVFTEAVNNERYK
jgi:hypothetical protein